MTQNNSSLLRFGIIVLCVMALGAGFLIANINVFNVSLIYLLLFLAVMTVGLVASMWSGSAISAVAVFALILLNQYVGIYPVQNSIVNISMELSVFLLAGPFAGWLSRVIDDSQKKLDRLALLAEERAVHDATFNTLKFEKCKIRLEEETMRAKQYSRPLSVAALQFKSTIDNRKERVAALQSLMRIALSSTSSPSVVSYAGDGCVLFVLPEYAKEQTQQLLSQVQTRVAKEVYFPEDGESLGRPLNQWGELQVAVASLGPDGGSADALLQNALAGLQS